MLKQQRGGFESRLNPEVFQVIFPVVVLIMAAFTSFILSLFNCYCWTSITIFVSLYILNVWVTEVRDTRLRWIYLSHDFQPFLEVRALGKVRM